MVPERTSDIIVPTDADGECARAKNRFRPGDQLGMSDAGTQVSSEAVPDLEAYKLAYKPINAVQENRMYFVVSIFLSLYVVLFKLATKNRSHFISEHEWELCGRRKIDTLFLPELQPIVLHSSRDQKANISSTRGVGHDGASNTKQI